MNTYQTIHGGYKAKLTFHVLIDSQFIDIHHPSYPARWLENLDTGVKIQNKSISQNTLQILGIWCKNVRQMC